MLEVDVEPKNIGGNAVFAQACGYIQKLGLRGIGVARLLKAERPERRQGCGPGQPCPAADHLLRIRAVEEVVVDGAVQRAEAVAIRILPAKVEVRPPRIVQEDADGSTAVYVEKEGDALIERVGRLLPVELIGVPHGESLAATVERAWLISQAEEVIVVAALLGYLEAVSIPSHGGGVLLQHVAFGIRDGELEAFVDAGMKGMGCEPPRLCLDSDRARAGRGQDGP